MQMKKFDLFVTSARQAITNKFTWLHICAALTGQLIPPLLESTSTIKYISFLIWILSAILSVILVSGLVYSVSQKEIINADISILDGWLKGWSKVIQVYFLNISFFVILVVFFTIIGGLLNRFIPFGFFQTIALPLFVRPFAIFSICAIIINNGSIVAAARTSVLMFVRNVLQTIAISGIFVVLQQVLLGIIILFIGMSPYRDTLLFSPNGNQLSYFKMLEIPQVIFYDQVLSLIMYPWIAVTFTHLYLRFINDSEYSVRSLSQEAA